MHRRRPCTGARPSPWPTAATSPARSPTTTSAPTLTLVKTVTNDNGGTATADRLDPDRDRADRLSAARPVPTVSNGASFDAGTYTLSRERASRLHRQRLGRAPDRQGDPDRHHRGPRPRRHCRPARSPTTTTPPTPDARSRPSPTTTAARRSRHRLDADRRPAPTTDQSGPTPVDRVTTRRSSAGTYTLTETGGPAGYTAERLGVHQRRDRRPSSQITARPSARRRTCTITNDDQAASLTLVKTVINDNGGTADAQPTWTLTATGPTGFAARRLPSVTNGAELRAPAPTPCPRPARRLHGQRAGPAPDTAGRPSPPAPRWPRPRRHRPPARSPTTTTRRA